MIRKTHVVLVFALLLIGPYTSYSQESKVKLDTGSLEGSTYTNSYLRLRLQIPEPWQVQGEEVKKRIETTGKQMVAGDNNNLKAATEAALITTYNLLTLLKYPLGSPVDYNPSFLLVAEKVSHMPGIKSPADYLFNVRRVLQMGQAEVTFDTDIKSEVINKRSFGVLSLTIPLGKLKVRQKYYVTLEKEYALFFALSYTTEEELKELQNILSRVEFQ